MSCPFAAFARDYYHYSFCSTGTGYGEAAKLFHFHFDDLVFFRQSSKKFTVMRIQVEWFLVRTSSSLFILG